MWPLRRIHCLPGKTALMQTYFPFSSSYIRKKNTFKIGNRGEYFKFWAWAQFPPKFRCVCSWTGSRTKPHHRRRVSKCTSQVLSQWVKVKRSHFLWFPLLHFFPAQPTSQTVFEPLRGEVATEWMKASSLKLCAPLQVQGTHPGRTPPCCTARCGPGLTSGKTVACGQGKPLVQCLEKTGTSAGEDISHTLHKWGQAILFAVHTTLKETHTRLLWLLFFWVCYRLPEVYSITEEWFCNYLTITTIYGDIFTSLVVWPVKT